MLDFVGAGPYLGVRRTSSSRLVGGSERPCIWNYTTSIFNVYNIGKTIVFKTAWQNKEGAPNWLWHSHCYCTIVLNLAALVHTRKFSPWQVLFARVDGKKWQVFPWPVSLLKSLHARFSTRRFHKEKPGTFLRPHEKIKLVKVKTYSCGRRYFHAWCHFFQMNSVIMAMVIRIILASVTSLQSSGDTSQVKWVFSVSDRIQRDAILVPRTPRPEKLCLETENWKKSSSLTWQKGHAASGTPTRFAVTFASFFRQEC